MNWQSEVEPCSRRSQPGGLHDARNKTMVSACACHHNDGASWCAGYRYADAKWTQRDTDRQLADAEAGAKLSEQYRLKEQKLNERIGSIETRAINDAAQAEAEHRADVERLRSGNGLRVKPSLTCKMPSGAATTGNGHEEVQAGLSAEVAERAIGIGAECDQVVLSLNACQAYVESLINEKPL